jgi:hypothetical protein
MDDLIPSCECEYGNLDELMTFLAEMIEDGI